MNKEKILKVAETLENIPGEGTFDMGVFFHPCGSPGCIIGWTLYTNNEERDNDDKDLFENARKLLGLSNRQAEELFMPMHTYAHFRPHNSEDIYISKKRATTVLENLAHTGEVNWRITQ